jgi:hypothetical protein
VSIASRLAVLAGRDAAATRSAAVPKPFVEPARPGFDVFTTRDDRRCVDASAVRDMLPMLVHAERVVHGVPVAFDLETTGIGRDAVPFLVGLVGFDDAGQPWLRQWQLADADDERRMWCAVISTLRALPERTPIITYNGASFDRPLVRMRLRRLGLWDDALEAAFGDHHHDLLPVCRRVWRDALPDVRLVTLEHRVLGVRRHGDPDGATIASDGAAWISGARGRALEGRMAAIRRHNAWDLEGLLALVPAVASILAAPRDVQQAAAVAKHALRTGDPTGFVAVCERWAEIAVADAVHGPALVLPWIDHLRRTGAHERAHALLRSLCAAAPGNLAARTKLAIDYEHRLGQPEQALALLEHDVLACPRRIARLQARVARRAEAEAPAPQATAPQTSVPPTAALPTVPQAATRPASVPGSWRALPVAPSRRV